MIDFKTTASTHYLQNITTYIHCKREENKNNPANIYWSIVEYKFKKN